MSPRYSRAFTLVSPLVTLLWVVPGFTQETTGRLEGRVVDSSGAPIPLVNVVVTSPSLQGARGVETGPEGRFVLLSLAVGAYTVKLAHLAYQIRTIEDVQVRLGQATDLREITLKDEVYRTDEYVVSGRAALIDPGSTMVGENISAKEFDALPIARDYKAVAALLPHANESTLGDPVNFAGATGLENRYFVDGVDVTDPFQSRGGTSLPYNFVQEVQVKTGGYEAENRSALGGTVNVITHTGSNEVMAQVFGFFTNNGFSATPRSVPGAASGNQSFARYDLGGGVGGPLKRDRLWYYAAYNPNVASEDVAIPGWGTYEDRSTTHSFAGKLTWRADDRNTIQLTSVGDPTRGRDVTAAVVQPAGVDPFLFDTRRGGGAVTLEGRHLIRDDLLIRSSLSRSVRTEESTPATEVGRTEPFFVDSTGVQSGGGPRTKNESGVTMAAVHATWLGADHEVTAGVEYRDTRLDFDTRSDLVIQSSAVLYYRQVSAFNGHVGNRAPSVFLEHAWSPTRRLQVHDGLRWDGQYWISSEGKVAQSILDQWQPRLGVTYQPGRLGSQKVSVSFGRYYQDLTTAPLFWYYNKGSHFFAAQYNHDPLVDPSGANVLIDFGGTIQPKLTGLQGQHFDELTIGYERQLGPKVKSGVRGIARRLQQGIEDGLDQTTGAIGLSNPGLGVLLAFPEMERNYSAVELSCQGRVGRALTLIGSYVLSRNYGNYEGLFDSRLNNPYPNATGLYDVVDQFVNADGLLPNDRTHVFKLSGSYDARHGLTLGAVTLLESGTPVSEFGGTPIGPPYGAFIGPRGSHGRTPALWDVNLRFAYAPPFLFGRRVRPTFTVDVFHLASQRKPVRFDEVHYRALDAAGNQINPNPNYGEPTAFQPPMAVRVGFQTNL